MNKAEKQQKLNKINQQIDEIQRDKKILVNLNLDMVTLEKQIKYEYHPKALQKAITDVKQRSPRGGV